VRLAVLPRRVLAPAPGKGVGHRRWADADAHRCDPAFAVGRRGSFDLNRDFQRELFLDRPTNVLLVKFNYWLSL